MIYDPKMKVADLTVGQLLEFIDEHLARQDEDKKIYGIQGLAEYLGCSTRTAARLKASGAIDKATLQVGRKLVFNERQLRKCCK